MTAETRERVALVTGASRGLGATMARALAAAGWSVAVNYSNGDRGATDAVEAIAKASGRARPARFDVTDEAAVTEGMAEIARNFGPVELIVNNATGPQPVVPVALQTWD